MSQYAIWRASKVLDRLAHWNLHHRELVCLQLGVRVAGMGTPRLPTVWFSERGGLRSAGKNQYK